MWVGNGNGEIEMWWVSRKETERKEKTREMGNVEMWNVVGVPEKRKNIGRDGMVHHYAHRHPTQTPPVPLG